MKGGGGDGRGVAETFPKLSVRKGGKIKGNILQ
jgi:hypothetical protein